MRKLLLAALLAGPLARAQTEYRADILPDVLTTNAHAVIRRHETTFTVRSIDEATQRIRQVITVLDEQGDEHATMTVGYDKLSIVTDFTGTLYDAGGKLIRKLRKGDITDLSTYSDYNLYDDSRQKTAQFPKQPSYPYTVEFVVETTERNLMFYPTWIPQQALHTSVEQATFTITMPTGLSLRYKETNLPSPAVVTPLPTGGRAYTWQVTNRPVLETEPLAPPLQEQLPVVYTAPSQFEVQHYKGDLTTWTDLGRFYYALNKGRDQIPDALRQQVLALVNGEKTTTGKVQKLYRFLQEQTRYVSVQLGLGGWQTIEADKVAASKYGDCKALTNYAGAMLKTVGITAYPALVRAGDGAPAIQPDFPSFQFNHVILCVPDGRDTLFLECTSGHDPAGYLGNFTGGRAALLVLPDGGRLIRTPAYQPADNRRQRHVIVTLNETGDATADAHTEYTGLQQDDYAEALHGLNLTDQRSWLLKRIRIPAFELTTFALTQRRDRIPAVTEKLKLSVRRWATVSGTRLFIPLNLMSGLGLATPSVQPRQQPLDLDADFDYVDADTIVYQLPQGYQPEYRIEPTKVESTFGTYTARVTVDGDRVTYVRYLQMHRGRYPALAYPAWVDFRRKIAKADAVQLVFVKK